MAGVSVHWRAAATKPRPPGLPPRPAQLPWMIFPGANPPAMYSVISGNFHHLYGLPADVRGARCCGSGDGGWLLLAFQAPHAPGYALYNLNSRQRVPLPATLMYPLDNTEYPLVVHVAAFSRPSTADAVPLVVGAIAAVEGRPTAAFWWGGLDTWTTTMAGEALAELPQDLIYIEAQDIFVFLTPREQLMNFMVVDGPDGNLVERLWDLHLQFRPDFLLGDVERTRRYILESRGQLLMVVRNVFNKSVGTTSIWLSELTTANDDGEPVWADNFVLDGRVLFLGPGCSRCFELASYNRVWDLAGDDATIYFLDETAGADTGRFSQRELRVEPWPPAPGPPRSDVPPTWWLHDA